MANCGREGFCLLLFCFIMKLDITRICNEHFIFCTNIHNHSKDRIFVVNSLKEHSGAYPLLNQ